MAGRRGRGRLNQCGSQGHRLRVGLGVCLATLTIATSILPIVSAILPAILPASAAAAPAPKRTYTFDQDPIRLGTKALDEGRLDEAKSRFEEALANGYQVSRARFGLAEVAVDEGRLADAETLYHEALLARVQESKKPDFPQAHAGLGLLMLRTGRAAEAAQEFQVALTEKPGLWGAVFGQAALLLQQEKWDEAKPLLDQGATRKGRADGEDQYHFGIGLYLAGKGDLKGAEKEALLALSLNPYDPQYGTLVARIYERRNVPTLAIDAYERVLGAPGTMPTAPMLRDLGALYQKVGRYNDARDRYQQAVAADSTYAPALKDLANLLRLAKQPDHAAKVYLRYVQLQPKDPDAQVWLAESCNELRQYSQALEAARAALAIDSTRIDARVAFTRAGIQSRDAQARAAAVRVYASLPDTLHWKPADYLALATDQIDAKQYPLAAKILKCSLELDPAQPEAWFQQGMLELNTALPDSAIVHFQRAIRLNPNSALYYLNLGIASFQAKHIKDAIAPFRKTLELNPDLTVGRVLLGQALVACDSLSAAEAQYRHVLQTEPANAKALRGLGFCLIRKADYGGAARIYKAASEAEPANADAWAGLGNANLGLQDWAAAEAAFKKAAAIDPNNSSVKKGFELLSKAKKAPAGNK
jgi:tetratricopeptide (TPR) repeat protein